MATKESAITLTARDGAVQSEHDQIVNLVAQHWATVTKCKVTISKTSEKEPSLGVDRKHPDIIGWQYQPKQTTVEWIAEVETEDSFSVFDAHGRWMDYMAFGVPFYLFGPQRLPRTGGDLGQQSGRAHQSRVRLLGRQWHVSVSMN